MIANKQPNLEESAPLWEKIRSLRRYFSTPLQKFNILNSILILSAAVLVFTFLHQYLKYLNKGSQEVLIGATTLLSVLIVGISIRRLQQIKEEVSRFYVLIWFIKTVALIAAICFSHLVLSQWGVLFLPAETVDALLSPVWIFLVPVIGVSIFLWRTDSWTGHWKAFLTGVVGGTLLLYLWAPLAYVFSYDRFVPLIKFQVQGIEELQKWALAISVGVLFLSGIAALHAGRPVTRGQAITFTAITGLTISVFLFTLPGSLIASIASQASLYNVAFSRVGYDETGWIGAVVNSTLYIFPWAYGALLACMSAGALPLLIGLLWPVRRDYSLSRSAKYFSSFAPDLLTISLLAVVHSLLWVPILATRIENTIELYGSAHWWPTQWIVPTVLAVPVLLITAILLQVLIQLPSRTPSFRNAMLLRNMGGTLFLGGLGIALLENVRPWVGLVLAGFGLELFFQAKRLVPDASDSEIQADPPEQWTSLTAVSAPVLFLMFQPVYVLILTLAMMSVAAINILSGVSDPPPGREWLVQLLRPAAFTIPVFSWLFHTSLFIMLLNVTHALHWARAKSTWEEFEAGVQWIKNRLTIRVKQVFWFYFILIYIGLLIYFLIALDTSIPSELFLALLVLVILSNSQQGPFKRAAMLPYMGAAAVIILQVALLTYQGTATLLTIDTIRLLWPALAILYGALIAPDLSVRKSLSRIFFLTAVGIMATLMIDFAKPAAILENGVTRFSGERWNIIDPQDGFLGADRNYSLVPDSDGKLWFVGYFGPDAVLQDGEWSKLRFYFYTSSFTSLDKEGRLARLENPGQFLKQGQNYWFTNESSVYMLVATANGFVSETPRRATGEPSGPTDVITRCGTGYVCPDLKGSIITSSIVDHAGNLWIGTNGVGLIRFLPDRPPDDAVWDTFTTENSGIRSDAVTDLLSDDQDRLWILQPGSVSVLSADNEWMSYALDDMGLRGGTLVAIYQDGEQRIWVGSTTGISQWNNNTWTASKDFQGEVRNFYEDSQGQIWALTSSGAFRYVNERWSFFHDIHQDPLWQNPFRFSSFYRLQPSGTGVTIMTEDQNGILWFGGPRGLLKYDPRTDQTEAFFPSNSGLPSEHVRSLFVDSKNELWVSTYTLNWAFRSEAPVVGLAILFLAIVLGDIYLQYQKSSQYRAVQISRRIAEQPSSVLKEIYQCFTLSDSGQVLRDLATHLRAHEGFYELVMAFSKIDEPGEATAREKAINIVPALHKNSGLPESKELLALYSYFSRALAVATVNDISHLALQILRVQDGTRITITDENSTPYELRGPVDARLANPLEMIGKSSFLLRKYLQIDNAQDKLGFIADSLGAMERARRDSDSVNGPEQYFTREICELWLDIIRRELDVLSGHADLRVEFRTRQVRRSEEVTLVLSVRNAGSAIANQVQVSLLPNAEIHVASQATRLFEYISAGGSETVEFSIAAPAAGDVRVAGEIVWSDRIEEDNRLSFADVVRFYESTGRFERIPNPYIVGHPVKSASLFQGREDIFDFISHNMHGTTQSRTLVLYGQRRTGKTSILYQLLNGRLGKDYIPILVDVQELAPGIQGMADLFLELALHMERALRKARLPLDKIDEQAFAASPTRSFSRLLAELEGQLGGRKIVLMFDEFELLEDRINQGKLEAESLGYLRSLMQHRDDLVFIFTGTHKLEQMSKDYWSIFFNIALHQQVSFMKADDATHLIREPVRGKLSIDDLVVNKILALTNGHPYFIQLLCWALVNYCNQKEKNYATLSDLNEILREIVSTGDAYFAYIWTQVSAGEKIVMSALAERLAPGKSSASIQEILEIIENAGVSNIDRATAIKLLDGLTDNEILMSAGPGGLHYSYCVGLIGEWVKSSKVLRYLVEREL